MAHPLKFPTSPEIKRVLSAVRAAGIAVSFIEIEPSRLRIFTSQEWGGGGRRQTRPLSIVGKPRNVMPKNVVGASSAPWAERYLLIYLYHQYPKGGKSAVRL